jgi:hypothetical protein
MSSTALITILCLTGFNGPNGGALASGTGHHTYFGTMSARPEMSHAYSLRSQTQIQQYSEGRNVTNTSVTYGNDGDPRAQDAAKVTLFADSSCLPISGQVRLPISAGSGKTLITWDAWWGAEFKTDNGGMITQKTFQVASPIDNSERFLEVRNRFSVVPAPGISTVDVRNYASAGGLGPSTYIGTEGATWPQLAEFVIAPETWTRYWMEVEIVPGGFDRVSLWIADERRDPVQLLNRLEIESAGTLTEFWVEFNSSANRAGGPLVAYVRNVVMFSNLADPTTILQRPWTDPNAPPPPTPPPYSPSTQSPTTAPPRVIVPTAPQNVRIIT